MLTALVVGLLTLLVYLPGLNNGFHLDDEVNITEQPAIHVNGWSLETLGMVLTEAHITSRPVANLSFAVDWWRGDGKARAFQATNIALHITTAMSVFALLLVVLGHRSQQRSTALAAAALAALVWALHPIQVQAVTYVVQRMASMSALFILLTVVCYLLGRLRGSWIWYLAGLLTFLLAAGSKEIAFATPVLLLLAEYGVVRHGERLIRAWWDLLLLLLPLLIAIYIAVDLGTGGPLHRWLIPSYEIRDFTVFERLLTQPRVLAMHFYQILWPLPGHFSIEHDFTTSTGLFDGRGTAGALLGVLLWCVIGVGLLLRRNARLAGFFMLWLPATLVIESSFLSLEMVFEHRMYLPTVGLAGLLAMGLHRLWCQAGLTRVIVSVPISALIIGLATATTARLPEWRDSISLYEKAIRFAPDSARVWNNYGQALTDAGQEAEAQLALSRALSLDNTDINAWLNRSASLLKQGRIDEALADLDSARHLEPGNAGVYLNHGALLYRLGKHREALADLDRAITLDPKLADAWYNRGILYEKLGRKAEAVADYRRAVALNTNLGRAHYNLGYLLLNDGLYDEALNALTDASRLLPEDPDAWFLLAQANLGIGKQTEALGHLGRSIALNPRDADALFLRGRLQARLGHTKQAGEDLARACTLGRTAACRY